jgi:hypothetical protein
MSPMSELMALSPRGRRWSRCDTGSKGRWAPGGSDEALGLDGGGSESYERMGVWWAVCCMGAGLGLVWQRVSGHVMWFEVRGIGKSGPGTTR